MPKYYCDYCDTFLTHDSPSVRKTHNGGRKHKENVRMYYQGWMEQQAQKLVDATTRAFKEGKMMPPGGPPLPRGIMPPGAMRPTMYPPGMPYPMHAMMHMQRGAPGAIPFPRMPMPPMQ